MKDELIAFAQELEDAAQFDNSSSGVRDTCDEVAEKLRKLAQTIDEKGVSNA